MDFCVSLVLVLRHLSLLLLCQAFPCSLLWTQFLIPSFLLLALALFFKQLVSLPVDFSFCGWALVKGLLWHAFDSLCWWLLGLLPPEVQKWEQAESCVHIRSTSYTWTVWVKIMSAFSCSLESLCWFRYLQTHLESRPKRTNWDECHFD